MKLVYQIPDKLYYIQNFLDYSTYKKVHSDIFKSNKISLFPVSKTAGHLEHWHKDLLTGFKKSPDRGHLISEYKPLEILNVLLKTNPFYKIDYTGDVKFQLHSMKDNSGINWHNDDGYKYGITYYINRRWNRKFGGEFLFHYKDSSGYIPLVGNSLVIVKAPLEHKVTPIMKPLVPRKTIQIFIPEDKQ